MRTAEGFVACIYVAGASVIQLNSSVGHGPVGAPIIRSRRIADANPRGGQAELVTLANDKRLACPVGDLLHGDLTVAEEDAVVVAPGLVRYPRGSSCATKFWAIRIDDSLRSDVIGRGW